MNVEIGTEAMQFLRKGIHKWDFRCSACRQKQCLQIADPRVEGRDDCSTVLRLQEICQLQGEHAVTLRFNYRP